MSRTYRNCHYHNKNNPNWLPSVEKKRNPKGFDDGTFKEPKREFLKGKPKSGFDEVWGPTAKKFRKHHISKFNRRTYKKIDLESKTETEQTNEKPLPKRKGANYSKRS